MQKADASNNTCPNCEIPRGSGNACSRCGFRFDVGEASVAVRTTDGAPEPTRPKWRHTPSARFAGRIGLVAFGIVIGAIVAAPSDDEVAAAKSSATKIERRADSALTAARADAKEIVADAEAEAERIEESALAAKLDQMKSVSALRRTSATLVKRRNALTRQVRTLSGQVAAQRRELQSVKAQVAAARDSAGSSSGGGGSGCHPSYSGACLSQGAGDYDCSGGSGDGPNYTGTVSVVGYDEFDLDRDGDGIACDD